VKAKYMIIAAKFIETHIYPYMTADHSGTIGVNEMSSRGKLGMCLILLSQAKDIVDWFASVNNDADGTHHWLYIMKNMFFYKMAEEGDTGKAYLGKTMQCMNSVLAMIARPMLDKAYDMALQPTMSFDDVGSLAMVQKRCGYMLGGIEGGIVLGWTEEEKRAKERQELFIKAIELVAEVGLASTCVGPLVEEALIAGVLEECLKKAVLIGAKQTTESLTEPITQGAMSAYQSGMQTAQSISGLFAMIIGGNSKLATTLMMGVNTWLNRISIKALEIKDHTQSAF